MLLALLLLVCGSGVQAQVTPQPITTDGQGVRSMATADVDGDGRTDVLAAFQKEDAVVWFRNRAEGGFAARRTISSSVPGVTAVEATDVDGDGDPDVLVTSYRSNYVAWYENRGGGGSGRFGPEQRIDASLSGGVDLHTTDFDGDGDPDLLAAAYLGDRVVWYENRDGRFSDPIDISTDVDGPREVTSAPIDGDGTTDVLVASQEDSTLGWFRGGSFGGRRVIQQPEAGPQSVAAADFDDDGVVDVVGAHDNAVVWFDNRGTGSFGGGQVIAEVRQGKHVHTADLDGDGDMDVLSASGGDDTVAWIENRLNTDGSFAAPQPLTTQADGAIDVTAADVDGDGFPDVLAAAWWDNRIVAFTNGGLGAPPPPDSVSAAVVREEAARVTWTAQAPPDAAGYRLYRAPDSFDTAAAGTAVGPDPIADTSFTETGLDADEVHHYRVLAVDSSGNRSMLSPSDTVRPDPPAPVAPDSVSVRLDGRTATLRWSPNDEGDLSGYRVYRSRSPSASLGRTNRADDGPLSSTTFTETLQTGGSVYYRVTAVDDGGYESPPSDSAFTFFYPERLSVTAAENFSGDFEMADYQLVALPGTVNRSLAETVEGQFGTDWMALWDDGASEDPFIRFDGSDTFDFRPGRGFWLIGNERWRVRDTISAVSLRGDSATAINVHAGWNIISNPYGKPVPWDLVREANGDTLQTIWQFEEGFKQTALFQSARTGEAYYFLNRSGLDSLQIPYPDAPPPSERDKASVPSALTLTAVRAGQPLSSVRVRLRPDARSGLDPYDQFAPTARFADVRLQIEPPTERKRARRDALAEEARPPGEEGYAFDLTLATETKAPVQLQTEGLDAVSGRRAVLVNEATGRRHDLDASTTVSIPPSGSETELQLRVGSADFVNDRAEAPAPATLTLDAPRPNPFRTQATLGYALPSASHVRMVVYDLLGRHVATLVNGRKEAGHHRVSWAGTAGDGTTVASGVYFVRLTADGAQKTRKVVRVE